MLPAPCGPRRLRATAGRQADVLSFTVRCAASGSSDEEDGDAERPRRLRPLVTGFPSGMISYPAARAATTLDSVLLPGRWNPSAHAPRRPDVRDRHGEAPSSRHGSWRRRLSCNLCGPAVIIGGGEQAPPAVSGTFPPCLEDGNAHFTSVLCNPGKSAKLFCRDYIFCYLNSASASRKSTARWCRNSGRACLRPALLLHSRLELSMNGISRYIAFLILARFRHR